MDDIRIEVLKGKIITEILGKVGGSMMIFKTENYKTYRLYHYQDRCEHVYILDIVGNLDDLLDSPILLVEEVISKDKPEDPTIPEPEFPDDSQTWTFYKFSTIKGSVTVRWFGSSNGYYGEQVDFCELFSC